MSGYFFLNSICNAKNLCFVIALTIIYGVCITIISINTIYKCNGNITYSMGYGDKSIIPTQIRSESEYNVRVLVLKQVDRITYMLSIAQANTVGTSEKYRALGFGVKSGLMSLEALIKPFIEPESNYYIQTARIKKMLSHLEQNYLVNSREFLYWELENMWLGYLVDELSRLGYFPAELEDLEYD